jgi:predicted nuclease of predicted toxin-antitoxin system
VRFLIDECLTVDLVSVAGESAHKAQHVARIGRAGWKDWNVVRYAREGDFILVTNNASDFRQLYAVRLLHAGLVILMPVGNRHLQRRSFKAALDELAVIGEPVNRMVEVDLDGGEVTLTLYELPPAYGSRHVSPFSVQSRGRNSTSSEASPRAPHFRQRSCRSSAMRRV